MIFSFSSFEKEEALVTTKHIVIKSDNFVCLFLVENINWLSFGVNMPSILDFWCPPVGGLVFWCIGGICFLLYLLLNKNFYEYRFEK